MWRLRWNFPIEVISNAWWQNRAYCAIRSSWAIDIYVKVFNLQNILNFKNTWPCTVKILGPHHKLRNSVINDKSRAVRLAGDYKPTRKKSDKICRMHVHIRKKKNRSNDDKGGYRHKKRETQIDNEKQDPLQFMSVWLPLISFISKKHDISFQIFVRKFEK